MIFLNEYIKLRTELPTELTHLQLDRNLQYVSNPWNPDRAYKEGMIVYHSESSEYSTGDILNTGEFLNTDGTRNNITGLTWFRANKDTGPKATFDYTDWDPIGLNSVAGQVIAKGKSSLNTINSSPVGVFDFDTNNFIVDFSGNTARINVRQGAFNIWNAVDIDPSTIYYDNNVVIGYSPSTITQHALFVTGNQKITGNLEIGGNVDGVDLSTFKAAYDIHNHSILDLLDTQFSTTIVDGDVLRWNQSAGRWENSQATVGGHNIGSHTDVASSASSAVSNNQILLYNTSNSQWENKTINWNSAPFLHNHDSRYYTKGNLNTSGQSNIHWNNITNVPNLVDGKFVKYNLDSYRNVAQDEMYTIFGDLTLNAGQTLDNDGRIVIINGSFINNGIYNGNLGTMEIVYTNLDYILGFGNKVNGQDILWTDSSGGWNAGDSTFYFQFGGAPDNAYITKEYLSAELNSMSLNNVLQNGNKTFGQDIEWSDSLGNWSTGDSSAHFNKPETLGNVYVTKEYVDSKVLPGSSQIMSPDDKFLKANDTPPDTNYELATDATISNTPVQGSYVSFKYNGVDYEVGNGNREKPVYFSAPGNGGVTAKGFDEIEAGDEIYWNGAIAGFELIQGDRISLEYLVNI